MVRSLEEVAADYFASMSSLALKLQQDCDNVRSLHEDCWDSLSAEKQEELIDEHIIDQQIVDKYAAAATTRAVSRDLLSCFPVLKINCGEKIIVDFEHEDGWTWTDEHSAPFSWKSRSQQDLTLAELGDPTTMGKTEPPKKNRTTGNGAARPLGPAPAPPLQGGGDDKNEVERMFAKFGIKAASENADETETNGDGILGTRISPGHLYNEKSKLLVSEAGNDAGEVNRSIYTSERTPASVLGTAELCHPLGDDGKNTNRNNKNSGAGKSREPTVAEAEKKGAEHKKSVVDKEKDKSKRSKAEKKTRKHDGVSVSSESGSGKNKDSKQCHTAEPDKEASSKMKSAVILVSNNGASDSDNVPRPLYISEPIGETSTDALVIEERPSLLLNSARMERTSGGGSVITSQPTGFQAAATDDDIELFDLTLTSEGTSTSKDVATVKTGFEFLDDW